MVKGGLVCSELLIAEELSSLLVVLNGIECFTSVCVIAMSYIKLGLTQFGFNDITGTQCRTASLTISFSDYSQYRMRLMTWTTRYEDVTSILMKLQHVNFKSAFFNFRHFADLHRLRRIVSSSVECSRDKLPFNLSEDRIRRCGISSGSCHKDTVSRYFLLQTPQCPCAA